MAALIKYIAKPLANAFTRVQSKDRMTIQTSHRSARRKIGRWLVIPAMGYLGFVVLLAIFQRSMIYLPSHASEAVLVAEAKEIAIEPWRDAEGTIIGWKRIPHAGIVATNRLLVFHGNAGFALDRTHYITGFERLDGGRLWEVYLFEYPGYGARPGQISEGTLTKAGVDALALLRATDRRPVFLLGESLGSGPACAIAAGDPDAIEGLLLVTPYSSMLEAASYHYPFVPLSLILRDRWDNLARIRTFHGVTAVMLAGADTVIPNAEGKKLVEAANEPKHLWTDPEADHNDLDFRPEAPWWEEVSTFLRANVRRSNR